jgi:hypothetical protein
LSGGAKASPFFFLRGPLATPDAIISRRFTGGGFTVDYSRFAEKYLDIKVNDGVAVVTLNRPERRNAIGADMHLGLEELFHEASFDVDLRAIVLTGAGEKAFSAGGDPSSPRSTATRSALARPWLSYRTSSTWPTPPPSPTPTSTLG